ncbi:NAD-dependent epimerase/dehydratase family protein [Dactylosporangium cerinum]|uniref:NAD-dependent epimerase/dehydratase family protein n=1 Tax=Dactylosporangium cerinum TaxID=1434730 RepID=A0ABV9WFJ7_9ACTN
MRVLLTGGTGFIGSTVVEALRGGGHDVTAVVRSEASAKAVEEGGAEAALGDLSDVGWLTGQLSGVDAAINLAALDAAGEDAVIAAVVRAFAGTAKPFVSTGGVWVWGDNRDITEDSALAAPPIVAWKIERQNRLLSSTVKASVVAPAVVYGRGRGLLAGLFTYGPRTDDGALRLVGSGDQHWATVHVEDLADLYLRVLGRAPGGEIYIGASGINPTVRELAQAAAGPNGVVVAESDDDSRERLGAYLADALLLDQQASGDRARRRLGWQPDRLSAVEELSGR